VLYDNYGNNERSKKAELLSNNDLLILGSSYSDTFFNDILLLRVSSYGEIIWNSVIRNPLNDNPGDLSIGSNNEIIVSGDFGFLLLPQVTGLTAMYDGNGNIAWIDTIGNSGVSNQIDDQGNTYVLYPIDTTNSILVVKYDIWGNRLMEIRSDSTINNIISAMIITLDSHGNILVAGQYSGYECNGSCYFLSKIDSEGNPVWRSFFDPSIGNDYPQYIATDTFDNIYLQGTVNTFSEGMAIVKFDAGGQYQWDKTIVGSVGFPEGLAIDKGNNVVICGRIHQASSSFTFNLLKYDAEGNLLWQVAEDTAIYSQQKYTAIAVDKSDNVYLAGVKYYTGGTFLYLSKYSSFGNKIWEAGFNTLFNGGDNRIANLLIDSSSSLIVIGDMNGSNQTHDIFVGKFSQPLGTGITISTAVLQVFPNPVVKSATLYLKAHNLTKSSCFELSDLSGRIVETFNVTGQTDLTISCKGIQSGMYLLQLKQENKIIGTAKIVIQ
jgi:hypothetical protein